MVNVLNLISNLEFFYVFSHYLNKKLKINQLLVYQIFQNFIII
jgi:hypothetical protein